MTYHTHPSTGENTPHLCPGPSNCFRTEFAIDGLWYTNALRFADPAEAVEEAAGRFSRWTLPAAWRVVTDDTTVAQPYDPEDPTNLHVSDSEGTLLDVDCGSCRTPSDRCAAGHDRNCS